MYSTNLCVPLPYLSSFNHRSTFSKVTCLDISYTNRAPTAPLHQSINQPMFMEINVM